MPARIITVTLVFFLSLLLVLGAATTIRAEDKTETELLKALELQPNNKSIHNSLGLIYYKKVEYNRAIEKFEKAIEIDPDYTQAHFNLGLVYYKQRQYSDAIENFQKVLSLRPNDAGAYYALAMSYQLRSANKLSSGDSEEALKAYKKAIEFGHKQPVSIYNNMGVLYNKCHYYVDAVKSWQKALEIEPGNVDAYNNLHGGFITVFDFLKKGIGKYHGKTEYAVKDVKVDSVYMDEATKAGFEHLNKTGDLYRYVNAESKFTEALKNNPNNVWALNGYALALIGRTESDKAVTQLKKAIYLDSVFAPSYLHLGNAYFENHEKEEAEKFYLKALELDPAFTQAWSNLGILYLKGRKYQQAKEAFEKALELKPEDKLVQQNLMLIDDLRTYVLDYYIKAGDVYRAQLQYKEAESKYREVFDIDPTYVQAYISLGTMYQDRNRLQEAMKTYEKALKIDENNPVVQTHLREVKQLMQ